MKNFILSLLILASCLSVNAQRTINSEMDSTLTNTSYGQAPDTVFYLVEYEQGDDSEIAYPKYGEFNFIQDSTSGGFGDSSRCTIELWLLPKGYTIGNKYDSQVLSTTPLTHLTSGTIRARVPFNFLGGKLYIVAYNNYPGVQVNRIKASIMLSKKDY